MAKKVRARMAPQPRQHTSARNGALLSPYDREIMEKVEQYGGFYNAHAHLDRADTLSAKFLEKIELSPIEASSYPLTVKQDLVGDYHKNIGYSPENLEERMTAVIERLIAYGTTRLDTNIDATPDLPEDGLLAIHAALRLKEKFAGRIEIRVAPTPIFGGKNDPKDHIPRWEVFSRAAGMCDYVSLLPEKDDYANELVRDGRLGFKRHIRMGVELACKLNKEVQFHLDQMNIPGERGTMRMLEMLEGLDQPQTGHSGPSVWVIHMISPSADSEDEFARLTDKLLELHVGVIVCPTAALSMRQLRSINAPLHNSIARVAELIKRRVPIRMGTDNIADVFVPASDGDMLTEIKVAAHATRINNPSIWAKLACGVPLNNVDITRIGQLLHEDRKACWAMNQNWKPAVE